MSQRFDYVQYDEKSKEKQEIFERMFEDIVDYAEANLSDTRARWLLLVGLEQAYMWTGKAIRDEQLLREGK